MMMMMIYMVEIVMMMMMMMMMRLIAEMIAEIEIVTEGGDELENIITYIVIIITYIVIITSYPSSLLICINIKHYIHHHYCLYVSISIIIIANLKLIDTSSLILQCSSQHLFRSHSIVLDCSDENGI